MNAVVRVLTQPSLWSRQAPRLQKTGIVWVMAVLLLLSALSIVFMKDTYRRSYLNYQAIQQKQANLAVTHNRLLLESATRLAQSRLASIAKAQGMVVPSDKETVWLHEESNTDS